MKPVIAGRMNRFSMAWHGWVRKGSRWAAGVAVVGYAVLSGEYSRQVMSRCHVSESELEAGCVLACRTFAESDLDIAVIGKMSKNILAGGTRPNSISLSIFSYQSTFRLSEPWDALIHCYPALNTVHPDCGYP